MNKENNLQKEYYKRQKFKISNHFDDESKFPTK